MTDLTALFQITGTIVLVAAPIIVLSWLLAGSDGPSLADILAIPTGPPPPRGIQEEEPVRYRVERLSRPRVAASHADVPARAGRAGRPVVESGPCV